jgi:hypothetical protein
MRIPYSATSDGSASIAISDKDGCIRFSDASPYILFGHSCVSLGAILQLFADFEVA